MGSDIPRMRTRICTFPSLVVLENDLFGGCPMAGADSGLLVFGPEAGPFSEMVGMSGRPTTSWRSWAHGASIGPKG